jgi:hypothetical protein
VSGEAVDHYVDPRIQLQVWDVIHEIIWNTGHSGGERSFRHHILLHQRWRMCLFTYISSVGSTPVHVITTGTLVSQNASIVGCFRRDHRDDTTHPIVPFGVIYQSELIQGHLRQLDTRLDPRLLIVFANHPLENKRMMILPTTMAMVIRFHFDKTRLEFDERVPCGPFVLEVLLTKDCPGCSGDEY